MVTIQIKQKTFECNFADETFSGAFVAQFTDSRRLPEIATDFDEAGDITITEPLRTRVLTGFNTLNSIGRDGGSVTVSLIREEETT